MDAHGCFHCAYEYEYFRVKGRLEKGVEVLKEERNDLNETEHDSRILEDLDNLIEVAEEVANGERALRDAQSVANTLEFGLAWMIEDPEECPGYAPELREEAEKIPLTKEFLAEV